VLIREELEKLEAQILSPYAAKSADSRGRLREEKECDIRTRFQRDRDRILYSKAFRRLKHKTQVFLSPKGIITGRGLPILLKFADSEDYCQKPKIK